MSSANGEVNSLRLNEVVILMAKPKGIAAAGQYPYQPMATHWLLAHVKTTAVVIDRAAHRFSPGTAQPGTN